LVQQKARLKGAELMDIAPVSDTLATRRADPSLIPGIRDGQPRI